MKGYSSFALLPESTPSPLLPDTHPLTLTPGHPPPPPYFQTPTPSPLLALTPACLSLRPLPPTGPPARATSPLLSVVPSSSHTSLPLLQSVLCPPPLTCRPPPAVTRAEAHEKKRLLVLDAEVGAWLLNGGGGAWLLNGGVGAWLLNGRVGTWLLNGGVGTWLLNGRVGTWLLNEQQVNG